MRLLAACAVLLAARAWGQPAPLAFDAASIKPSDAPLGRTSVSTKESGIEMRNVSLRRCISIAYGLPEAQAIGGAAWVDDMRYDIDAKAAEATSGSNLMAMLGTLLGERFQLKTHRETRPINGYALVSAKGGIRIKPVADSGNCSAGLTNGKAPKITATSCPMAELAKKLAETLRAPVDDQSGAGGMFTFTLEWTPDEVLSKSDAPAGASLTGALGEQLGLKLEARKVKAPVVIIDSASRASAN